MSGGTTYPRVGCPGGHPVGGTTRTTTPALVSTPGELDATGRQSAVGELDTQNKGYRLLS